MDAASPQCFMRQGILLGCQMDNHTNRNQLTKLNLSCITFGTRGNTSKTVMALVWQTYCLPTAKRGSEILLRKSWMGVPRWLIG